MSHRFQALDAASPFVGYRGDGVEARPLPGLLYLPPSGARRRSRSTDGARPRPIALIDALHSGGSVIVTADGVGAETTVLRNAIRRARLPDAALRLIWLCADGAVIGLSLDTESGDPTTLAPRSDWQGRVAADAELSTAAGISVTFAAGTAVALEVDEVSGIERLRFETSDAATLPTVGLVDAGGPVTLELFADKPGVLRFAVMSSSPCPVDIRFPSPEPGQAVLAARAFSVPPGPLEVQLQPAEPFDHRRTRVGIGAGRRLTSGWGDSARRPVALDTVDGSAVAPQPAGDGAIYLTPCGPFAVVEPARLVCGLAGFEFLQAGEGRLVSFEPGRTPPSGVSGEARESTLTTAWLSAADNEQLDYYSQPGSNPLYAASDPGFLRSEPVIATALTAEVAVPTVPWLGYDGPAAPAAVLERSLSSHRRRLLLDTPTVTTDENGLAEDGSPEELVTAGGLRAQAIRNRLVSLTVAEIDGRALTIDLKHAPELRAALVADDSFIVLDEAPPFANAGEESPQLVIGDWRFDLDPARWATNGTALLIKQRQDRPLAELVADPATWTGADALSGDRDRTAARLERWVADAAADGDPAIQALSERVLTDPHWQGVLIIAAPVRLGELPHELSMLQDGIPTGEAVLAHHLTVDRSPLERPTEADQTADSSVSGLVCHPRPGADPSPGLRSGGFEYRVASLRVAIVETVQTEFEADVELGFGSILDIPVTPGSSVVVRGRQRHVDNRIHYAFETTLPEPVRLTPVDAVIAAVTVDRADLRSVGHPRFELGGSIDFHPPQEGEPDLIGYRTLTYRGLGLAVNTDGFHWDTAAVKLGGTPKPGSIPDLFPLQPAALLLGAEADRPSLGLLPVRLAPQVEVGSLRTAHLGIDWRLDLGSMGSLADDSSLLAHLVLLWSPDRKDRRLQLGLRLPGSDVGAYGFSLQDLVGIGVHGVVLDHHRPSAPRLLLNGLSIDVLGLAIPWGGRVNAQLTPGPDGNALGWYGAYTADRPDPAPTSDSLPRRSANGRR